MHMPYGPNCPQDHVAEPRPEAGFDRIHDITALTEFLLAAMGAHPVFP
jgi:hypothetical protein